MIWLLSDSMRKESKHIFRGLLDLTLPHVCYFCSNVVMDLVWFKAERCAYILNRIEMVFLMFVKHARLLAGAQTAQLFRNVCLSGRLLRFFLI